jgi:hypothetical protein
MAIGTIGASADAGTKSVVLINSDVNDVDTTGISVELSSGVYRVNSSVNIIAGADTIIGGTANSLGIVNSDVSSVDLAPRAAVGTQEAGTVNAIYSGTTAMTIGDYVYNPYDKTLWGFDANYASKSADGGASWVAYTTQSGNSKKGIPHFMPGINMWAVGVAGGQVSYYGYEDNTNTYYTTPGTAAVNGFATNANGSNRIAFQDDALIAFSTSGGMDWPSSVNIGVGSTDLDGGEYVAGNDSFVVFDAAGNHHTASAGNLASWTNQGGIPFACRLTGGSYKSMFQFNGKTFSLGSANTNTPFWSTTNGTTWVNETSMIMPQTALYYAARPIKSAVGTDQWYEIRSNGANTAHYITKDFVNFVSINDKALSLSSQAYLMNIEHLNELTIIDSNVQSFVTFPLGQSIHVLEYVGPLTDANA